VTRPRIAVVVATTAGGTGRHAAMLAAGCAQRGLPVSVLGPAAARRFFEGPERYLPVEIGERPRPARDAAAVLRLSGLLSRDRPDVVHAHGLRAAAAASLALALTPRRPALLVTVHNAAPPGAFAAAVYRALERLAAWRADLVLCVSPDLAERMRRAGAREVRLAVIAAPDAPAPPASAVARARADIGGPGHQVILGVGRLAPQKGFDVLIDAVARLRNREPPPLLAIAGEGPLAGTLAARARGAGVKARFLGARSDVPALLAAADVVAVPSRWEGQPLVVQEALRAGRPVVASRAGGIPVLTGEDAALLVPPGDPGALAGAIASVLDDPGLSGRLGAAAAARAPDLPSAADAVADAADAYTSLAAAARLWPRRLRPRYSGRRGDDSPRQH
jgi:glycosyltransferase involved in cell wall biosynthesis